MLYRPDERFNYLHSSLCLVIEWTFGIWKNKWKILRNMPRKGIHTQSKIIVATMVLHNFVRAHEINNNVNSSRYGAHLDVVREVIMMPWHMQSQSWTNLRWNKFVTISQHWYVQTITDYGDYYFCHNRNLVWLKIPLTLWKFFYGDQIGQLTRFNIVIPFFVILLVSTTEGS